MFAPRKWKTFAVAYALALTVFLFGQHRTPPLPRTVQVSTVVDLTHDISEKTPNWEGSAKSPFSARTVATYAKEGYFAREVALPEHFSTHLDAPAHFARGLWTVDQIPAERLVRPLVVLDVTAKAAKNPDYLISVEDVAEWERANGEMPAGAVVLAHTGWDARWNSMKNYRNADAHGVMHFPGWALETAKFLVEGRNIVGLGIDTLSADYGPSKDFPVHHYCADHSVYLLENVADLGMVPHSGGMLVVAPIKLAGGSGGPVRLLALVK